MASHCSAAAPPPRHQRRRILAALRIIWRDGGAASRKRRDKVAAQAGSRMTQGTRNGARHQSKDARISWRVAAAAADGRGESGRTSRVGIAACLPPRASAARRLSRARCICARRQRDSGGISGIA